MNPTVAELFRGNVELFEEMVMSLAAQRSTRALGVQFRMQWPRYIGDVDVTLWENAGVDGARKMLQKYAQLNSTVTQLASALDACGRLDLRTRIQYSSVNIGDYFRTKLVFELNEVLITRWRPIAEGCGVGPSLVRQYDANAGYSVVDLLEGLLTKQGDPGLGLFRDVLVQRGETRALEIIVKSPCARMFGVMGGLVIPQPTTSPVHATTHEMNPYKPSIGALPDDVPDENAPKYMLVRGSEGQWQTVGHTNKKDTVFKNRDREAKKDKANSYAVYVLWSEAGQPETKIAVRTHTLPDSDSEEPETKKKTK